MLRFRDIKKFRKGEELWGEKQETSNLLRVVLHRKYLFSLNTACREPHPPLLLLQILLRGLSVNTVGTKAVGER